MNDVVLDSFVNWNLSVFRFPIIVVYKNPTDYPNHYAARLFDIEDATVFVVLDETVEGIRNKIPEHLLKQYRDIADDEKIVETYF